MIRRLFYGINRFLFAYAAKPILFIVPPDMIHSSMIRFTSTVGRVSVIRLIVRASFKGRRDERLVQNYHGVEFDSPVGLAAGFDKSGEVVPIISALGFGFGTVGSVTAKRCIGNPRPWFYRLPKTKSLVVNAGLANEGSRVIIKRLGRYSSQAIRHFPIVLSIAKTNNDKVVDVKDGIADYVTTLKRAKDEQSIKMIEFNISCPNAFGGEPFTTPSRLDQLLTAVDEVGAKQPIYIKMPVDLSWGAFRALLDVIVKHQVVGVTIANLAKDRTKVELKDDLPANVRGNLSGQPTWQLSNELIRQAYLNYGDKLTIIGVGGIFSAEDAYAKIRLGASLVEIITGMIFCGPQLAAEINDGLLQLLERDGYTHISQAIGVDAVN
jgi:dihydroorotate dehydrogenase (fumarate)